MIDAVTIKSGYSYNKQQMKKDTPFDALTNMFRLFLSEV